MNDYEYYRVNIRGLKPQSSGVGSLITILLEGLESETIDITTRTYIGLLLESTSPSIDEESIPCTLTSFFGSITWLRHSLGEKTYLQLESPKRLTNSFSVAVASTLLLITEAKMQATTQAEALEVSPLNIKQLKRKKDAMSYWSRDLFLKIGNFSSNGTTSDIMTELMFLDAIKYQNYDLFFSQWKKRSSQNSFPIRPRVKDKKNGPEIFSQPLIFSPEYFNKPSPIEQLLFSWLCAWQTVQPSDIAKLKPNDFRIERNSEGRPLFIQCTYYKGRSARLHEPPMVSANRIEGKAILAYLSHFSSKASHDFNMGHNGRIILTFNSHSTLPSRLLKLWSSPKVMRIIDKETQRSKCSSIFLDAYKALGSKGADSHSIWQRKQRNKGASFKVYIENSRNPIPCLLFGLSSIKTSAVYSRTDRYRDSDLVNQNSHSAATEKVSYLTDHNKEWVNHNGRLTRIVLHDLENYVYKPNLSAALHAAHDLQLRTTIIDNTHTSRSSLKNIRINPLGRMEDNSNALNITPFADEILVCDTEETVVNMRHYISEAHRQHKSLITHAASFFERTVLPTVEWMEYLLQQKISPLIVKQGNKSYSELQQILPPLFSAELLGGLDT